MFNFKLLLISVIFTAIFGVTLFLATTERKPVGCQSDIISIKSLNHSQASKLVGTVVLLFDKDKRITLIYRGVITTISGTFLINRTYDFTVEKIKGSDLYYVLNKKLYKSQADNVPAEIENKIQLDHVEYFTISQIKDHSWLVEGIVSPEMMCVTIPEP